MASSIDWDEWERLTTRPKRWADSDRFYDPIESRFSSRRPASLTEAFERSLLNGVTAFTYQHIHFQNTMPGSCIQVIGQNRVLARLRSLPLHDGFLRRCSRIQVAEFPDVPSYVGDPCVSPTSHSYRTVALCPYVAVSKSAVSGNRRHFTLYLADKFIDGAAHFNPIFFETHDAQVDESFSSHNGQL